MICKQGKVSVYSFFGVVIAFCLVFLQSNWRDAFLHILGGTVFAPVSFLFILNILIWSLIKGYEYQITVRAANLGYIFGLGLYISQNAPLHYSFFGVYMCIMSVFHYTEFLAIAIIQPTLVSTDSFVINHSPQYTIAAVTSWVEFAIESYFFPGMKSWYIISNIGLVICICGEILRKVAMLTAQSNFNHLVQCEKSDDHVLVTHGVYSLFRHPSYVGWFYWSIGTQIILLNPICIVAYALASWFFFRERITIEEIALLNFFGQQYCDYQQNVSTGLPFIQGYKIKP